VTAKYSSATMRLAIFFGGAQGHVQAAAERVRQLPSGRTDTVEKKMVSGLSFGFLNC